MKKNVGSIDKVVRIIIALIATYFAFKGCPEYAWVSYVLYAVAIVMLLTALFGCCGLYSLLGVNTCKTKE